MPFRPNFALVAAAAALVALAGCASKDPGKSGILEPYRFDIPQGNYLTREMVDAVKPGMSREEVRNLLGTPLLQDSFHPERWDYVFRYLHANRTAQLRRATVHFKGDVVERVEADPLPSRDDRSDPALPKPTTRPLSQDRK